MSPLKIWFLADQYGGTHGGTERQFLVLIRALVERGHEARLFVLRQTDYSSTVGDFPCPIECLDVRSMRSLGSLRQMARFRDRISRERPDVVHAFFNDSAILAPLFCRTSSTAVVTSRRDMGFWHDWRTLLMLRLANLRTDAVICNAKAVAEQVERLEKISRSRLRVIYNGIEGLEATLPHRQSLQTEHGSDSHECRTVRICLLANVRRIKRIEDFLRAAAQLKKSCLTSEFLVIGHPIDAGYQHELDALIDDLGLATRVRFVSDLKESLQLLNTCDIGVLTSESEGLSNSILEYMRAELPVVCSNTGGNPELVTDGENGFTYPVGDFAQLAARLEHLCMDDAKRRVMGRASWKNAARFTVAAMTDFHLGIYRELGCSNSSRE